jgi:hypothetical protein
MRPRPRARTWLRSRALALVVTSAHATGAFAVPRVVLAQTSAVPATAPSDRDSAAAELRRKGDELAGSRQYAEALAAYDESYRVVPNVALLYNRGRALQFLARYAEALESLEHFALEASPELRARVPKLDELLAELRGKVASIDVHCPVLDARILLDQRQVAVTPTRAPIHVNAGHAVVEILAEGYQPFHQELDLPGGQITRIDASLVARSSEGMLVVRSNVAESRVTIDGQPAGMAPAEAALSAGPHTVRVEHPGYDAVDKQIVLVAGKRREVTLDPRETPAFYTRWWFLSGIGAAVVGGVVLGVALTRERPGATGDFSPGSLRVP